MVVGIVALGLVLIFVKHDASNVSVLGTYQRIFLGVKETVSLNPDGSFEQALDYPSGATWKTKGKWVLIQRAVQLDISYYYCNDDTGKLDDPPVQNSSVTFEVVSGGLSRDVQPILRKVRSTK